VLKIGTYAKVDLSDFSVVARGQRLPRSVWGDEIWADPEAHFGARCPADYAGFGWWPEFNDFQPLGDDEKRAAAAWQAPDQVERRVVLLFAAVPQSEVELRSAQVRRLAELRGAVSAKFDKMVDDGYEAAPGVRVGLTDKAFVTMQHAVDHLSAGGTPFTARTSLGSRIHIDTTVNVQAVVEGMRATYLGFAKREDALQAALDAAESAATAADMKAALDAINVEAGWV
jgi:hypothetical protein